MNRTMCGGFLLATLAGLAGCSGDPANALAGTDLAIQANPSSLFMAQGDNKPVIVTLIDAQGNEQAITSFQVSAGSGAVTAVEDTTYQPTNNGSRLETTRRISITGQSPAATTVNVVANGQTLDLPVRVTPTATTATVSNPTPAANEPLVITLAAPGYKFGSGAGANIAGAAGAVQSVAPDSSSITVLLPPGASGPVTVDSVGVDYAPGVLFSLPTDQTVTVGPVTPLAGTGSPASAPAITIQPAGGSTVFFDGGTYDYTAPTQFGAVPARMYTITVADTTALTTTVDWPSPEDIGLYFFQSDGTTELTAFAADPGAGGVHPESKTNTFPPGTYKMAVVNWNAPTSNPPYIALTVTTE